MCLMPSNHILFDLITRTILCSSTVHEVTSSSLSSSSSSSHICRGVGPLADPFQSHVSRSLFKLLTRFLLPVAQDCFITLGNLFRGILFTCCIQRLLYSSNLSKIAVILTPLQFVHLFCNLSKCILLFFSCISSLLLLIFWRQLL